MNGSNPSKSASVAERDALLADHRWMDGELERLTSAFKADDLSNIQAVWSGLEPFLLAHMESEEDLLYPTLARWSPESVLSLAAEHAEIRRALESLSLSIELHTVRVAAATALASLLRAHARREDILLFGVTESRENAAEVSRLANAQGDTARPAAVDRS